MNSLNILKPYLLNNYNLIIVYLLYTIFAYPLETILLPKIFSNFFSNLNSSSDSNFYITFFLNVIFFTLLINISFSCRLFIESNLIPEINEFVINYIYKKILKNSEKNMENIEIGKLISRLQIIPLIFRELITEITSFYLPRFITVIIVIIYFFFNDITLGLITLGLCLFIIFINIYLCKPCIKTSAKRYVKYEKKTEEIQDKLNNLTSIYNSGNIDKEVDVFKRSNNEFKQYQQENMLMISKIKYFNNIILLAIFLILNGYLTFLYKSNQINYEKFISLFLTNMYFIPTIKTILISLPDYISNFGIIDSLQDFLSFINTDLDDKPDIIINYGSISLRNLRFGYTDRLIFNNINLEIKAGEKIAIIGESGNGKTTLIKLILGYIPISDNMIYIDNNDINNFNLSSIKKNITYINQNVKLFNNTIYYNISYGNDLTNYEIDNFISRFKLENIFSNLQNKLNTFVGPNGDILSGGQKQIINILRGFGINNKIIILDEPTSALDLIHRDLIINMISDLGKNSTIIMITHDFDNLKLVNRCLKINNNQIENIYLN